jgi:hypothetical protein
VSPGPADHLDRVVAQGKVDLERRRVGRVGREAGPREEALRHPVVTEILLETSLTPSGDLALAAEADDQTELFQRPKVGERRGSPYAEAPGDRVQRDAVSLAALSRDEAKGFELPSGQSLERLHDPGQPRAVFMVGPNF